MPVPSATVTEEASGAGIAATPPDNVVVHVGCSSKGALNTPTPFTGYKDCAKIFGAGPLVKAAAYANAKAPANFLAIRLPATARPAVVSAIDVSDLSGTLDPSVTGTPNDNYEVIVEFTAAGTTGVAGILYKYSLDGGKTFTTPAALGVALTIALTGTGLSTPFSAGKTVNAGDSFTFYTLPASQSILPLTVTRANSGSPSTSVITVTGTPEDDYELVFEVLAGGTVGQTGITYRYSLDGGRTWTPARQLGTANAVTILDGPTEPSGLTVNLAAGTLDAGDKAACGTTAPEWQASDLTAAMGALGAGVQAWTFIHAVGTCDKALAGSVGGEMETFEAAQRFAFAVISTRDRGSREDDATWSGRVDANFDGFVDERIAKASGRARITCPLTGRQNRRPVAWIAIPRLVSRPIHEELGRVATGALSSDVSIHDADNNPVEHDGRTNGQLYDAKFIVLRTFVDRPGVYFALGHMSGVDVGLIPVRRVKNKADKILQQMMESNIGLDFRRWGPTAKSPYKAGDVYEPDALRIERVVDAKLRSEILGAKAQASDLSLKLLRTPVSLGGGKFRLVFELTITSLGYVVELAATSRLTDPALDALLTQPS